VNFVVTSAMDPAQEISQVSNCAASVTLDDP